ncbi:MAG: hypothetical protein LBR60_08335 [Fibrobacter sp.]|jgi:predicted small lipoprotein YifL|nr:hypothetical protein [Fibrobacter sp.]
MRLFWFLTALILFSLAACGDGKLNLPIVFWGDDAEEAAEEKPSSGSSAVIIPESSSGVVTVSSSSVTVEPGSSSSVEESSSSSSSRGERSSSSKEYEDYPVPIPGGPGVKKGWATRYWDACKPHCSWLQHNFDVNNPQPWKGICKNCNKENQEITTYEEHPTKNDYFAGAVSTKSACDTDDGAYTCWDMAPVAINDTLAYGFAAMNPAIAECGSCYQLTFDGGWYDEPMPRPTHQAIKSKTMIVMASNVGQDVKYDVMMKHGGEVGTQFDIMIPGGGVGAFNALSKQIGVPVSELGVGFGGNLSNCIEGKIWEMYGTRDGSHRATLEQWQGCLRAECERVFGDNNIPGRTYSEELYRGCMWHADWFMAADNPTLYYQKVDCPKYLTDKFYSTINTEPPPLPNPIPMMFMIEGNTDYKQTGWYD